MRVLVTGANSFIGSALLARAALDSTLRLRGSVRQSVADLQGGVETVRVGDLAPDTNWAEALRSVDAIVHTAARVHVLRESATNPLAEFRWINVAGTLNLARQAAAAGVQRFVFISSIGVNGAETFDVPFTADDRAAPHSPYSISKHEAELGLKQLAHATGLDVVIIRPPLVYGPKAKGNFDRLLKIMHQGIPLPLGAIQNRLSLVALDNLVDLIVTCLIHPAGANRTFLVSDGDDISTTDLLRRTGAALGKPARLMRVPPLALRTAARFLGKAELAQRLCGSLQVDIGYTRELLGWNPRVSVDEALKQAARHFLANLSGAPTLID